MRRLRDSGVDLVRQHDEAKRMYRRGAVMLVLLPIVLAACGAIALLVPGAAMVAVTVALLFVVAGTPAGLAMYETGRATYRRTKQQLQGGAAGKQLPAARLVVRRD